MAPSPWQESGATVLAGRLYPPAKEVLSEIQRDQRSRQERRPNPETNGHLQYEMVETMEGGQPPCPFPSSGQHGLHRQHPQNQCGVPSYPAANGRRGCGQTLGNGRGIHRTGVQHRSIRSSWQQQQQRGASEPAMDGLGGSGETAGSDWSGGLGHAGGSSGCWEMTGGETVTASPRSSVSSDESRSGISGGRLVVDSPAAEWEVDCTEEGDVRLPGERTRRRSMGTLAGSGAGLQQLQTMLREPSASSEVQSVDELKRRLQCNSMELESARTSFEEEFRKKDENIMQLLQLLKMTSLEREAREMLQELLNKIEQSRHHPSPSYIYPEEPSLQLPRYKSDFAESDSSISFTHSHQLYSCSPVETPSDMASATKLHHIRSIPDSGGMAIPQQALLPAMELSTGMRKLDRASAVIDGLVMKKPLPEKGKLLQAVMEAGPLLTTLLVAGSLPQWRNPPPLKPFDIPLVSLKAREAGSFDQNALLNPHYMVQSTAEAFQLQYAASSMKPLNLGALSMRVPMPPTGSSSHRIPSVKRQKI
ncbi:hypothetical protein Taro_015331 [Colocasia esculenta]|uniref:Uncharacterized protein n=1 Tax=Colocasia esculenta TaxID=4460 RepID=A0A843USU3_COLES|nr:hypothetical protein [Colocasia esculenta]